MVVGLLLDLDKLFSVKSNNISSNEYFKWIEN